MDLRGKYLRGALWDGRDIYLVEANRRVFHLYPWADKSSLDDYGVILSVTNSGALVETHVKSFAEIDPGAQLNEDIAGFLKTYEIKTGRGICLISVKANVLSGDFGLAVADYNSEPHEDIRKLHDF